MVLLFPFRLLGPRLHPVIAVGLRHLDRGELEPAVACFDAVAADRRDAGKRDRHRAAVHAARTRADLARAHFHAGDFTGAERELTCVLDAGAGSPGLRYLRARVYERSGRLGEALNDLDAALTERPRFQEALLLVAVCLDQLGDRAGVEAALARAAGLGFDLPVTVEPRGGVAAGDAAALTRAVEARPAWADLRCALAARFLEQGRAVDALAQLAAALRINPRYLEARRLAVRACLERGDAPGAVAHAEVLVGDYPGYPDLQFWLGLARFRAGDLPGAARALERAVARHHAFARAYRLLGVVYHALGRGGDAVRALHRALARNRELPAPDHPCHALEDGANAAGMARALAIHPDYPDLHLAHARARREHGDLEGARQSCRAALALAPGYGEAALELAGVELSLGSARSAEATLEALARRHPDWADVHARLGRTRLSHGDLGGAEPSLRAALVLNPGDDAARADLDRARDWRERFAAAPGGAA